MSFIRQRTLFDEDKELEIGLQRARNIWLNRTYVDSIWKVTNENRRASNISTIESLLSFYKMNKKLTPGQRELAKKLIENANKK